MEGGGEKEVVKGRKRCSQGCTFTLRMLICTKGVYFHQG